MGCLSRRHGEYLAARALRYAARGSVINDRTAFRRSAAGHPPTSQPVELLRRITQSSMRLVGRDKEKATMRKMISRIPARWLVLVGVLILAMVPTAVIAAGGTFTDDDDSVFESNIEWLASAGVTLGCNPPTNDNFCPDENVSRGQMAAFMQRFAQYLGAEDGTPAEADNAATADSATQADNAGSLGGVAAADVLPGGTLPMGAVLRGTLNVGGSAAAGNDLATADISYGFDMGSPLTVVIIDQGDTPPDTCPGTPNDPAADPGYLCIFSTGDVNTTLGDNMSQSYGVTVFTRSEAAGDFYTIANWAASAPGAVTLGQPAQVSDSPNGS